MQEAGTTPTDLTRVRRKADRGRYDRATIDAILDEGLVCHVAFAVDGQAWAMPTAYARDGDRLYLHGAAGNFMLKTLGGGARACVTVTLVDGLVLARSAFHHSINYRSVMLFGRGETVDDPVEKHQALLAIVEHLVPGRAADTRPPTDEELRATRVVRFPVDEASAKVRTGGPVEDPDDLALGHWAGVLPLALSPGTPQPDAADGARPGVDAPDYVRAWRRGA